MSIPVDLFSLDPDQSGSLQMRIRQMVAEGILSGHLRRGERMPSSRRLAEHLGVARITVTLAYAELVADDYLTARGRSGYFVSDNAPLPRALPPERALKGPGVDWARRLGGRGAAGLGLEKPPDWRAFRFPFVYGQADPTLFDYQTWRACTIMALGQKDYANLTDDRYERDDPDLVDYIVRHTLPRRGIRARPEEILITLGAQNALWLAATLLLNQRRTAAIEDPGYPALRLILNQTRCRVALVPVGPRGLDPETVPEGVDVLFCTPSHHCPTGATLSLPARRALLRQAQARDMLVVEDDYEFRAAQEGRVLPALKALDPDGRVVHVGSFSKSLFPGLRLGYLVGAPAFIREARALRATVLRHPPGLTQRAAAYFLSLGHYDALIRRLGQALEDRRKRVLAAVPRHGLTPAGVSGEGASSLWMRAPGLDARLLAEHCRARGVLIEPGHPFFGTDPPPPDHFRIGWSSIPAEAIDEGLSRLGGAIRALSGTTASGTTA